MTGFDRDAAVPARAGGVAHEGGTVPDLVRDQLIAAAKELHDREGCSCDPRYLTSCPRMAAAILRAPKQATVQYPTEKCRTCQAPIIWAVTERDKDMPVDAHPDPKGNVALSIEGSKVRARVVAAHLAFGRKDLRLSHFVLCPDAPKWRQRR